MAVSAAESIDTETAKLYLGKTLMMTVILLLSDVETDLEEDEAVMDDE